MTFGSGGRRSIQLSYSRRPSKKGSREPLGNCTCDVQGDGASSATHERKVAAASEPIKADVPSRRAETDPPAHARLVHETAGRKGKTPCR
jgi:hypothetical protein